MRKIFIVEDDENIRNLITYALKSSGFLPFGFENSSDFFFEIKRETPDLVMLDIMLPDSDGLSILKKIRQTKGYEKLPIIMLTAKGSEYDKIKGLDMGADDYIVKPFSILELMSRINAILRRTKDKEKSDEILNFREISLDLMRHTVQVENKLVALTFKEFELLQYLMENTNIVLSRENIMERVWGFDFESMSRTVDMHIKTLRQKLGQAGEHVKTIRNVGYKIGD